MRIIAASLISSVFWIGSSHTAPILKVEDITGGVTTTVNDNGLGDDSSIIGHIDSEIIASGGAIISNLAYSNGNADLQTTILRTSITSIDAIDLVISLTDTDLFLRPGGDVFFISAYINHNKPGLDPLNTLQVDYFHNGSNVEFDTSGPKATKISYSGLFPQGRAELQRELLNSKDLPFSLTQVMTIHLEANQTVSFSSVQNVPEPNVILLIGLGLIGLITTQRRKA